MRVIKAEEVAKHNSKEDCWIVIHGKVYDVTKWLFDHPGGIEVIVEAAGKDASKDFDEVMHSTDAIKIRDNHLVGEIEGYVSSTRDEKESPDSILKKEPATDDSGAFLAAVGVAAAAVGLAVYLIRG